jgi:hypothetical protein
LEVKVADDHTPSPGEVYTLLTYASRSGDFARHDGLVQAGLVFTPVPGATNYTLFTEPAPSPAPLRESIGIRAIDFEKRTILLLWERPSEPASSTTIPLIASCVDWARHRRRKAAANEIVIFDQAYIDFDHLADLTLRLVFRGT